MKRYFGYFSLVWLLVLLFTTNRTVAQSITIDDFEEKSGWSFIRSDGVNLSSETVRGYAGQAIRFDYDFTKGSGYGGIQKLFPLELPDNFEFSFYLRAESPANNFEIKFIDSTGDNVWWVNNRNFDFPDEWKKIRIKKRHISFAWGPTEDKSLKRISRIEFTVASFVGGKGTLWIDSLRFQAIPPEAESYPVPSVVAMTSLTNHPASLMTDRSDSTFWQSKSRQTQHVLIDFKTRREFGGLQINWLKDHFASSFDILLSEDGKIWEKAYSVALNRTDLSFLRLSEAEARFVKIDLLSNNEGNEFGINEIKFLDVKNSLTRNDFLIYAATNSELGDYPRYFRNQASYWTIAGVNNDVKEALLNEDGMVEVEKALFSIEPMIGVGDSLYNWCNVQSIQSLGSPEKHDGFDFTPTVTWKMSDLAFSTSVTAIGEANKSSMLQIHYQFENHSASSMNFNFYLLMRPYQVNPWYQFLNLEGGAGKIHSISKQGSGIQVDEKFVLLQRQPDAFGVASFDEGNPAGLIRNHRFPDRQTVVDDKGLATGMARYSLSLPPGEKTGFYVVVPFYGKETTETLDKSIDLFGEQTKTTDFWRQKVGHIRFELPESADRIIDAYRANLAYILLNRDIVGIQPGSRSYERSWIRDGALTSSALLKSGIVPEVKDFIEWYAGYQYENGKVPCVVDFRGPDPVPENDSHGQLIYLIREYFNFTRDTAFLRSKNVNVLMAVDYIESLVAERSTDWYKHGNDSLRAHYGLVPESISHEGYSAKPMHSYWDNFFILKGLKDAADIQTILGEKEAASRISRIRDTFRDNLYRSIDLAMKLKGITYIPGCVELGDFDATSTTIALTPCNELINLPKPQVYNTFDKYYDFFRSRRDGQLDWVNYTPYENRLIGSFILLDQPDRAHELIDFFLNDQRPSGWHHWAEVVWQDDRTPRFIGDMPHTWVGSDFINAIRSMFVYENELEQTLVIASALYQDWIDSPKGMSVENLPTYYGEISYSIKNENNRYIISISGDVDLPVNGLKIKNFNKSRLPVKVTVNGTGIRQFDEREISVSTIPSEVVIYY